LLINKVVKLNNFSILVIKSTNMLEEIKKVKLIQVAGIIFVLAVIFLGNTTANGSDAAQLAQVQEVYEVSTTLKKPIPVPTPLPPRPRTLYLDNSSCLANIKSGWNLVNIGDLICGFMQIESGVGIKNFPARLDMFVHDGNEYIHARITRQEVENRRIGQSIESALMTYIDNRTKDFTGNEFRNFGSFFGNRLIIDVKQNNESKIKEYARVLSSEVFTSVWVYNPGQDFSVLYYHGQAGQKYLPRHGDEETAVIAAGNLLFENMSSSDFSRFITYIEDKILDDVVGFLSEGEEGKGYLYFLKRLAFGEVTIDEGWNFLSYSKVLADDNGYLNFFNGNCRITKAYLFDNQAKKWVNIMKVGAIEHLFGNGIVVYNSGNTCNLVVENKIVTTFSNLISGGSTITPPPLPD